MAGPTVIDTKTGAVTVNVAEAAMEPALAQIVALPAPVDVASPRFPASLVTAATA